MMGGEGARGTIRNDRYEISDSKREEETEERGSINLGRPTKESEFLKKPLKGGINWGGLSKNFKGEGLFCSNVLLTAAERKPRQSQRQVLGGIEEARIKRCLRSASSAT